MIEGEADFKQVGWVDGEGTSHVPVGYSWMDPLPADRMSYYRLEQVDVDGHHVWSNTVVVGGARSDVDFRAYPNPAQDHFVITGPIEATDELVLYDATGREVRSWAPTSMVDGLGGLPRGVYTLVVSGSSDPTFLRIVLN